MAAIDISGKEVIGTQNNVSSETVLTIKDSGDSKVYLLSLQSGVLKLTNIADDTEVLSFTKDA